ncbi:glycosyltransferase [Saccharopolyspora flava]|uniref:Glycosyltransferase involved in cell wall bisynthesis n=1 Tax=Saccharopolyspora flava TaxID=95161 RepID=A0A1I6QK30_9PSEU|nr:glycosyltransferase [Saccharopolyspora flava]SFS52823.1 Glycosyltransferase involved in cell wall bisynthesis [Saccharopolyspora flava]
MFSSTTELRPLPEPAGPRIVAIVPCHNEAVSVTAVIRDLREAVPGVTVYVYDNNCTDSTAEMAERAGAIVRRERLKGKGNVVRRAFADIDADVYLLIDGDDTYDASRAGELVAALLEGPYDHVIGTRTGSAYRRGHAAGNRMFNLLVGSLFGMPVRDMLSGYRVLSRRFVKSFPAQSREFEIETELTVHAMNLRVPQVEVPVKFKERPEGSESKLRTVHDGSRILWLISELTRHERPLLYFGVISMVMAAAGLLLGIPVIAEFAETGAVPRLPTALLASSLMILALLMLVSGLVLDGLRRSRREATRLAYLALPALDDHGDESDEYRHHRVRAR